MWLLTSRAISPAIAENTMTVSAFGCQRVIEKGSKSLPVTAV